MTLNLNRETTELRTHTTDS